MKEIVLIAGCMCVCGGVSAQDAHKYILAETPQHLVFVDNPGSRGHQPLVAFAYYEVRSEYPDYLFVSIMQADCQRQNRLQLSQVSAANVRYGITKPIADLTQQQKQWTSHLPSTPQGLAWEIVCQPQQRQFAQRRQGTVLQLMNEYQLTVHSGVPKIR